MGALSSHPITVYSGKANRAEQCEKGLLETGPHLSDDVLGVGKVAAQVGESFLAAVMFYEYWWGWNGTEESVMLPMDIPG